MVPTTAYRQRWESPIGRRRQHDWNDSCVHATGAAALDVADRQNAHSATLAVRGVVELFRLIKQEKELH
jgi:hypothetical protein